MHRNRRGVTGLLGVASKHQLRRPPVVAVPLQALAVTGAAVPSPTGQPGGVAGSGSLGHCGLSGGHRARCSPSCSVAWVVTKGNYLCLPVRTSMKFSQRPRLRGSSG